MAIVHEEKVIQITQAKMYTTLPVENPGDTNEINEEIDTIANEKAEIERKYNRE